MEVSDERMFCREGGTESMYVNAAGIYRQMEGMQVLIFVM